MTLIYLLTQDAREIVDELRKLPELAELGVTSISMYVDPGACFGLSPPETWRMLTEYHNTHKGNFFMTTDPAEIGAAGPGWEATGQRFEVAFSSSPCDHWLPMHRFYAPSENTHMYTMDPAECGSLLQAGSPWRYEGVAFETYPREWNGACLTRPLYRVSNNRQGGAPIRHRWFLDPDSVRAYAQMGWVDEGIAACIRARKP